MPTTTIITHTPYEPATPEEATLRALGYLSGFYGATTAGRGEGRPCSAARDEVS